MTRAETAYLAGFFDGEGSISLHRYSCLRSGHLNPKYKVVISCVNTDRVPVARLQTNFGGALRLVPRRNPRHKPVWRWDGGASVALRALKAMLPYLTIKAERAKLVLEFQRGVGREYGRGGIPAEEKARRDSLIALVRGLNQRGVAA